MTAATQQRAYSDGRAGEPFKAEEETVDVGAIDLDIRVDGQTTIASARLVAGGEVAEGYGIARCRKDDHFETAVGVDIAGGRAIAELGRAIEAIGLRDSKTERQHEADSIAKTMAHAAEAFMDVFKDIARTIRDRG